jgi:ubiquinone/menaquinone biosynthesis C-methylase UbiE
MGDNSVPSSPPDYASAAYWDHRYTDSPNPFEWYEAWGIIQPAIAEFIQHQKTALNVGCGTSPMSTEMLANFSEVVNIDISPVAIAEMKARFGSIPSIQWLVMDCLDLKFPDGAFDVVLDKGTLDALFCGETAGGRIAKTLKEVHRVLRPGGSFIDITYGRPSARLPVFRGVGLDWQLLDPIQVQNPSRAASHWIYVFRKGELTSGT